ncbi:hypothetical protein N9H39_01930 [Gammaproteobacteria bacterium]|nr:hypothetical protein [Gammaproteobacteria bacterium]
MTKYDGESAFDKHLTFRELLKVATAEQQTIGGELPGIYTLRPVFRTGHQSSKWKNGGGWAVCGLSDPGD